MARVLATRRPEDGLTTPRSAVARRSARVVRIRGQAFRSLFGAIGSLLTPEQVAEVMTRLEPEVRALLPGAVNGTQWYSLAWYKQVQRAACDVGGSADFARRLGREARRLDARGVYRFILRFVSPESLIRNSASVMALYLEGPTLRTGEVRRAPTSCSLEFEVTDADGFDDCLWEELLGSMEQLFRAAGSAGAAARVLEHDPGWLRGEISWPTGSA